MHGQAFLIQPYGQWAICIVNSWVLICQDNGSFPFFSPPHRKAPTDDHLTVSSPTYASMQNISSLLQGKSCWNKWGLFQGIILNLKDILCQCNLHFHTMLLQWLDTCQLLNKRNISNPKTNGLCSTISCLQCMIHFLFLKTQVHPSKSCLLRCKSSGVTSK